MEIYQNPDLIIDPPEEETPPRTHSPEKAPVDARDYFSITKFQKKAASLDEDKTHPWESVHNYFIAESERGAVATGVCFDDIKASQGLLIVEKIRDQVGSSVYLRDLTPAQLGQLDDAIKMYVPHLEEEIRYLFIRQVIEDSRGMAPEEIASLKVANRLLNLLPDIEQEQLSDKYILSHSFIETADPTKQKELADYLILVSKKMFQQVFKEKMEALSNSIQFREDPHGKNYPYLFSEIGKWVVDSREDTEINYELMRRDEPEKYFVKDMVTRPISAKAELASILSEMVAEPIPDIQNRIISKPRVEMVDLAKLVGGSGIENWSVSTSEGRGLDRIFEIVKGFQDGSRDVVGRNDPIKALKVDGKYYIEGDGRHRCAGLKALGVKDVPMIVTEVA